MIVEEERLTIFINKFKHDDWFWEQSSSWREDDEIPIGVAVWFLRNLVRKFLLCEIPKGVSGFYCRIHKRAYLERTTSRDGSGCDKCSINNIWKEG